jgi:hypothetical protein
LAKLDDTTNIELGFPHDFLTNDFVKQMVLGGTHASIIIIAVEATALLVR